MTQALTTDAMNVMTDKELKDHAKSLGVDLKGNVGRDTLIERVCDKQNEIAAMPLETTDTLDAEYQHESGASFTGRQVLEAVAREADMDHAEWNAATDAQREAAVDTFVGQTNFVPPVEQPVGKPAAKDKKSIGSIFDNFPGVEFDMDDVSWTAHYRGQSVSGNNQLDPELIRHQLERLTSRK